MSLLPTSSTNSLGSNWNTVNDAIRQLNNEQITKTYKQPNGNVIVEGKLPYSGGYGTIYYDSNGVPIIIIGILPDGNVGIAVAKPGNNVIDAFS